jgi:hypothetical protein
VEGNTYDSNGDVRRIREDKLHFFELLPSAPILREPDPACATVTEAVGHDYSRRVPLYGGDDEGCWGWHFCVVLFRVDCSLILLRDCG